MEETKRRRLNDSSEGEQVKVATSTTTTTPTSEENTPERRIRAGAARYHCNYCQRDITNLIRIKCAQCADFDLCLECFSVGVEAQPHKSDHNYRVMDNMSFPIFEESWGADEELLLLEAIQMYGMGNWVDVQEHVGTKTKQECEDHYFQTYINTQTCPLPDPSKYLDPNKIEKKRTMAATPSKTKSESKDAKGPINLQESRSLVSTHIKSGSGASGSKSQQALTPADVAGYMPLRNDFEIEYDNDAEMIIADMEILPNDSEEDRQLKIKLLQIYFAKLEERGRRKFFVLDRGLLDFKKLHTAERRKPKEERELIQKMRVFARFHSQKQHQELIDGILKERELRRRIALLTEYRQNGITTLAEAQIYELDKKKHQEEESKRLQEESSYGSRLGQRNTRYNHRERTPSSTSANASTSTPAKNLRKSALLDVSQCVGVELLSDAEKNLCASLHIIPRQYMLIKDVLVRECERNGFLKLNTASNMLKIDATKTGKLYEFFVEHGWVRESLCNSNTSNSYESDEQQNSPRPIVNLSL